MVSLKITENIIIKVLLAIKGLGDGDPMEDLTYKEILVCPSFAEIEWS